jgi:hypothetical protein
MIVDIGMIPLEFYMYGSDDSEEVGEHQDGNMNQSITGTRRNVTHSLAEKTSTVAHSLTATKIDVTQKLPSLSSKMAMYNNNKS